MMLHNDLLQGNLTKAQQHLLAVVMVTVVALFAAVPCGETGELTD